MNPVELDGVQESADPAGRGRHAARDGASSGADGLGSGGEGGGAPGVGDELETGEEVLTGRRLGRYRVGPVVHDGPMSTLYRADDVRLDRPVALKVISPLLAREEEFRARFVEEARSLSAVDHPHVVPLYDHDEQDDGHLWLAMRWVDGVTLARAVAGRPLALARCLGLFDQVAAALDAVHACGLVHLDVKPANILITEAASHAGAGRGEHVYLADFGLTRRGRSGGRTGAGEFVGSPAFASPEHLRGEPVGAATDLYGLACSLHTALTGRPPYLGTVDEVIAAHLAGRRCPASRVRGEVVPDIVTDTVTGTDGDAGRGFALGPAVDAELARALAPNPADRHASAAELLGAVRAAMGHDGQRRRATRYPVGPAAAPPGPPGRVGPAGPGSGSVHAAAPARRLRPAVAPLTEDLFTTSRSRAPVAPRDPRVVLAVAAVLSLLVLVLATVLA